VSRLPVQFLLASERSCNYLRFSNMACELVPWQSYVTGAILDPLNHTSDSDDIICEDERNRLHAFYLPTGGRRRLRKMSTFNKAFLNKRIAYYSENVHLLAIFARPSVDLNISCPGVLDINQFKTKKRRSKHSWHEDRVTHAVAQTALQTSQTIFQQLDITSYRWQWGRRDTRSLPMMPREPYVWAQWQSGRIMQAKVAVFTFPSKVFESSDLSRFVYTDTFLDAQPFQDGGYKWDVPQMLWAMVYDFCVYHGVHHFVLTTYDKWIFGLFTESFRAGYVRHEMDYNARSPTVLQTLIFWMDASMRDHPRV